MYILYHFLKVTCRRLFAKSTDMYVFKALWKQNKTKGKKKGFMVPISKSLSKNAIQILFQLTIDESNFHVIFPPRPA